ncbi:MAG: pilus assembly protein [Pseudomonadota bacterium]
MVLSVKMAFLKARLAEFRDDVRGSIMVETVITLPLLIWAMVATYEFFEIHRYQSVRDKASYTIADMLSREQLPVNTTYIDNVQLLYDQITNDDGVNQVRVSVIEYAADTDTYETQWSEVRGVGSLGAHAIGEFPDGHEKLPIMSNGEPVVLVESVSTYVPMLDIVFSNDIPIETRVFTSLRFSPNLYCSDC